MNLICISDTHSRHNSIYKKWLEVNFPEEAILLHSGDFSNIGELKELVNFCEWLHSLPFRKKVFIAGNHDFCLEKTSYNYNKAIEIINNYDDIVYLHDESIIIDGIMYIKIYGSPWQPKFFNWAFNLQRGDELREKWNLIPHDVDVLLTHGPVAGILDIVPDGYGVGCDDLNEVIKNNLKQLKLHVCVHIHDSYGYKKIGDTLFLNASIANERYIMANKPFIVKIEDGLAKLITYIYPQINH